LELKAPEISSGVSSAHGLSVERKIMPGQHDSNKAGNAFLAKHVRKLG